MIDWQLVLVFGLPILVTILQGKDLKSSNADGKGQVRSTAYARQLGLYNTQRYIRIQRGKEKVVPYAVGTFNYIITKFL